MPPSLSLAQQEAARITSALDGSMMSAARMLRSIRDQRPADLVEVSRQAGMSLRKAHQLARIATIFDGHGIPDTRLERIGSAKLGLLSRHVAEDAGNLEELLALAEGCSQLQLRARLLDEPGDSQPDGKHASMLLHLPVEEDQRFRQLLCKFGATARSSGLAGKEAALIALMDAIEALPRQPAPPLEGRKR